MRPNPLLHYVRLPGTYNSGRFWRRTDNDYPATLIMITAVTALRATHFSGSKFSSGHCSDGPKIANELQLCGRASKYIRGNFAHYEEWVIRKDESYFEVLK